MLLLNSVQSSIDYIADTDRYLWTQQTDVLVIWCAILWCNIHRIVDSDSSLKYFFYCFHWSGKHFGDDALILQNVDKIHFVQHCLQARHFVGISKRMERAATAWRPEETLVSGQRHRKQLTKSQSSGWSHPRWRQHSKQITRSCMRSPFRLICSTDFLKWVETFGLAILGVIHQPITNNVWISQQI